MDTAKDALKRLIGRTADVLLPSLGRDIDAARHTTQAPKLKRAILFSRLRRAEDQGDAAKIEEALNAYWRADESWYYDNVAFAEARFSTFREHHATIIDHLRRVADSSFGRLVEIGCGDGSILAYAAARLPTVREAIGLDINAAVIARNLAAQPSDDRLKFVNGDARDWLEANLRSGTIAFTNNGVLEYFSQASFDRLLRALASRPPAAIALVEPVAPDHDLRTQSESYAFGKERSFSHNHRTRLIEAGFDVCFEKHMWAVGVRWILMIGVRK